MTLDFNRAFGRLSEINRRARPSFRMAVMNIARLAGLAAVLVYAATVVVGGWLTPGYSHLDQPVSALFERGAPYALPVSAAFLAYNLLLVAFGLGLVWSGRGLRAAGAMIMLNGIIGLAIEAFPMDEPGAPVSAAGFAHIVLAGGLVATCVGAMVLALASWRRQGVHPALGVLTVALLVAMLAGGLAAAQAATGGWPLLGLYQRLTIGSYLAWIAALSVAARPG